MEILNKIREHNMDAALDISNHGRMPQYGQIDTETPKDAQFFDIVTVPADEELQDLPFEDLVIDEQALVIDQPFETSFQEAIAISQAGVDNEITADNNKPTDESKIVFELGNDRLVVDVVKGGMFLQSPDSQPCLQTISTHAGIVPLYCHKYGKRTTYTVRVIKDSRSCLEYLDFSEIASKNAMGKVFCKLKIVVKLHTRAFFALQAFIIQMSQEVIPLNLELDTDARQITNFGYRFLDNQLIECSDNGIFNYGGAISKLNNENIGQLDPCEGDWAKLRRTYTALIKI